MHSAAVLWLKWMVCRRRRRRGVCRVHANNFNSVGIASTFGEEAREWKWKSFEKSTRIVKTQTDGSNTNFYLCLFSTKYCPFVFVRFYFIFSVSLEKFLQRLKFFSDFSSLNAFVFFFRCCFFYVFRWRSFFSLSIVCPL